MHGTQRQRGWSKRKNRFDLLYSPFAVAGQLIGSRMADRKSLSFHWFQASVVLTGVQGIS